MTSHSKSKSSSLIAPAWGEIALLLIIIVVALSLRLWHLGDQSLWIDEATAYLQNSGSLSEMLARARVNPLDFPLDRLFQNLVAARPPEEFLFRLPAALFGVLAVPLTYAFTRSMWGNRAGLLAAGLLALSPYHIRYSQEARNYSSFLVLHLLCLILLIHARRKPAAGRWLAYAGATTLMIYDHLYAFIALGLQLGLHTLYTGLEWLSSKWNESSSKLPEFRLVLQHAFSLVFAGLLFLPWVLWVFRKEESIVNLVRSAGSLRAPSAIQFDLDLLLRMLRWFINNANSDSLLMILMLGAALMAGILLGRRQRITIWFTLLYVVLTLFAVAMASRLGHTYLAYRRLIFLLPLLLATATAGIDGIFCKMEEWLRARGDFLPKRWTTLGLPAFILLAAGFLWWPAIQEHYRTEKEDWRQLAHILRTEASPNDLVINYALGYQSSRALEAYLGPDLGGLHVFSPEDLLQDSGLAAPLGPATIWRIFPFPLEEVDANHRTLNDPTRLRVLDGDRSLPPIQLILALEQMELSNLDQAASHALVIDGLQRTALTQTPTLLSWRFNALKTLTTAYDHSSRQDLALEAYHALSKIPDLPDDIRTNVVSIAAYLEQALDDDDSIIVGSYWDDSRLRKALVDRLYAGGLINQRQVDRETIEAITRDLALALEELPIQPNLVAGANFDDEGWVNIWDSQLTGAWAELNVAGCAASQPPCLLIESDGPGYHGSIQQVIPAEEDILYLLTITMRTESLSGLQGKALYLEYQLDSKTHGSYASAFWGSAGWHTFAALFASPAGVSQFSFSPVLIDNEGLVWIDRVQAVSSEERLYSRAGRSR